MPIVTWNEWYEVGIPNIDVQHQDLFRTINNLDELDRATQDSSLVSPALVFLEEYLRTHFREEESLMAAHAYPGLASHREEHRSFLEQLAAYRAQQQADPSPGGPGGLARFLLDWLARHIVRTDRLMGAHLKAGQNFQFKQDQRSA